MNKELYIPHPTKFTRTFLSEIEDFFGAAFQQLMRSWWVDHNGDLVQRTFISINSYVPGEEDQMVTKSNYLEIVPESDQAMSFDLDGSLTCPDNFAVIVITEDLPEHVISFGIRRDIDDEGPQWSVTGRTVVSGEDVQYTGTEVDMKAIVCDKNHPDLDQEIHTHMRHVYRYGLDREKIYIPLRLVPPGNLVVYESSQYKRIPGGLRLLDSKFELRDGEFPSDTIVEFPPNNELVLSGLPTIKLYLVEIVNALHMLNRNNISFTVEDPMALVRAAEELESRVRDDIDPMDPNQTHPSVGTTTVMFEIDYNEMPRELHVSGKTIYSHKPE